MKYIWRDEIVIGPFTNGQFESLTANMLQIMFSWAIETGTPKTPALHQGMIDDPHSLWILEKQ